MNIKVLLLLAALSLGCEVSAQSASRIPSEQPRLIVSIVVEQMRSDYIRRFWDKLGEGGFKRLIGEGTYYPNAYYDHFYMHTATGHATLYTGTSPAGHGIVADQWYDRANARVQTATGDTETTATGGSFESGRHSPRQLISTTIGDEIKMSVMRQSKVFGISLDPVAAVLSAGHTADGAFWFDPETGRWATSSYYMKDLPAWLTAENNKKLADIYLTQSWTPAFPVEQYTHCLTDANPYEIGIEGRTVFPYILPDIARGKGIANRYRLLLQTPFGNSLTKDMAIATIANENLGKDEITDFLTVSFAATEHIGNAFGTLSIEVEDAFVRLDREIEFLLKFVDETVGRQNTLVILTSDHGAAQTPAYMAESKIPVGSFNYRSAIALLRSYLNALYGNGDWIKSYEGQQLYLNADLIENSKMKLGEVQQTIALFLLQFTGVAGTITAETVQNHEFTEGFRGQVQNGFFPRRSGDVFVNLYPGWIEKGAQVTAHNSAYVYDTQVPLIWYGWKIKRDRIITPVNITAVAPTIAALLNIMPPNAATGKVLTELTQ